MISLKFQFDPVVMCYLRIHFLLDYLIINETIQNWFYKNYERRYISLNDQCEMHDCQEKVFPIPLRCLKVIFLKSL